MTEGMGEDRTEGPRGLPRRRLLLLRREREAAAGVVSILLSILVIIILLTLVTSVWMPEWMQDIESDHMREVNAQFADLKANIDKQTLKGDTKFVIGNPLTLGAQGFAVFGSDSAGTFSINSFRDSDLEYYCNVMNQSGAVNVTATGGMKYQSHNTHYVNQQLAFENGAIILKQGSGEVVRVGPQFAVEKHGPVTHVTFVLITVSGAEASIRGTGTILVQTQLVTYTNSQHDFVDPQWLNLSLTTEFPVAWARYFNNTLIEGGLTNGADFFTSYSSDSVNVNMANVTSFDMGYALFNVEIQDNAGATTSGPGVEGLVGLWHLNEDTGATARDSSLYHNDGIVVDGTWSNGVRGADLNFDGNDDHVVIPEIPEYNKNTSITVMLWCCWTVDPSSGNPWANLVSKHENQWEIQHSGNAAGSPYTNAYFEWAVRTNDSRKWIWSTTEPVADQWYHVSGVFDSTTHEISIYVNGTLENSTVLNGTIDVHASPIHIGAKDFGGPGWYFEGDIDEIMIFDRALAAGEIYRYYQSLKP
jgi:hypothetical protein